jgi:type IV secretory pathway VirB10-like protein
MNALPGERMDESEMLAEIDSSRKWFIIAAAIVGVAVIILVIYLATHHGPPKAEAPPPEKPVAVAVSPPAPPTVPSPSAPSPSAPSPSPPTTTPPTPPESASAGPAGLVAAATAAEAHDDYATAVDKLEQASRSGADPRDVKRVSSSLQRALTVRAKTHKKKERAGDLALLVRLKHIGKKK